MTEIELLRKENERLIAENTYLKKLLDNNGISYEYTPKQTKIEDTASEIKRRIKLFMKLFSIAVIAVELSMFRFKEVCNLDKKKRLLQC